VDVPGQDGVSSGWADSYQAPYGKCYCSSSNYDHSAGIPVIETSLGWLSTREICELIGPGPGKQADSPVYNDLQCGNGPPNDASDEHTCPGRVDLGKEGCGNIGPQWDLSGLSVAKDRMVEGAVLTDDTRVVIQVEGKGNVDASMANSYSVGDECFCLNTLSSKMETFPVEMASGNWTTVKDICEELGPGPGSIDRPLYNDVQCGNGPPQAIEGEHACPGRVDMGPDGCGHIGPTWKLDSEGDDSGLCSLFFLLCK